MAGIGRLGLIALFSIGLLAVGCGRDASVAGSGSSSEGPEPAARAFDRTVRWESALLEDLGHSVTIAFTGGGEGDLEDNPCVGEYDVKVEATKEAVTITLYSLRLASPPELLDDFACTDEGYARRLGVTIGGDGLMGRRLVDGASGETRVPIDETAMLLPRELPDGWSVWYRGPQDSAMVISYGPTGGSGSPPLTYLVAPTDDGVFNMDRENIERDLTTVAAIGVRGNSSGAFLVTSLENGARTIFFEEGGRHHRVTIQSDVADEIGFGFVEGLD